MARYPNVRGGRRLAAFLRKAKAAKHVDVDVGFFASAKYDDGTPVAAVAAWNELGTSTIPERAFFRNALRTSKELLLDIMVDNIDPRTMTLDRVTAGKLGAALVGEIQRSITTLRQPANAPSTIALKKSSNPLLDTGFLRQSVTWRVGS